MSTMHVIISNAAFTELASSGITPGWLTAWLLSTGKKRVTHHHIEDESWQSLHGAQLFIGEASELMPIAMAHGRRLGANKHGNLQVIGADTQTMSNPKRLFWHYPHRGHTIVLMPVGDVVHQRKVWLTCFAEGELLPVHITADASCDVARKITVEPGLYAHVDDLRGHHEPLNVTVSYLNHQGLMPEEQLLTLLSQRGWQINTAESCTAGGIAARIARVPGASAVLNGGWVTYSNAMKTEHLGVSATIIEQHGAVSEAVVLAMVKNITHAHTMAIAVSGIAGPDGGSEEKPIGTVWAAIAAPNMPSRAFKLSLKGSRASIQAQAAMHLLAESCVRLLV
jgi:PncC family amidohydrolase